MHLPEVFMIIVELKAAGCAGSISKNDRRQGVERELQKLFSHCSIGVLEKLRTDETEGTQFRFTGKDPEMIMITWFIATHVTCSSFPANPPCLAEQTCTVISRLACVRLGRRRTFNSSDQCPVIAAWYTMPRPARSPPQVCPEHTRKA